MQGLDSLLDTRKGCNGPTNIIAVEDYTIGIGTQIGHFIAHWLQHFETCFQWKSDGTCAFFRRFVGQMALPERLSHRANDEVLRVADGTVEIQYHDFCFHLSSVLPAKIHRKMQKRATLQS